MTDLAVRETSALELATAPVPTAMLATLADWANEARAAGAIARSLCETSFVPKHFRGSPAEATAAILTGHELGLSPMASLRSIYVIGGTPAMYAITLRAIVQSKGHAIWTEEATATRVIVAGRRLGSDRVERSVWTVERAKAAELLSNAQYRKNPQNMLTARATVEVCRLIAADAIHGIPYAVEELDDDPPTVTAPAEEIRPATRKARRATPAATVPVPEPELDEPTPDVPEGVEPITDAQQRKLHALLRERGLGDRENGLAAISKFLGREVTSTRELSKRDAMRVIDQLEQGESDPEPEFDDAGDDWPPAAQPGGE